MRGEFLPDRFCDRRSVMIESRKAGAQGALTRSADFVSDRVIVTQVERAQERPKGESLERPPWRWSPAARSEESRPDGDLGGERPVNGTLVRDFEKPRALLSSGVLEPMPPLSIVASRLRLAVLAVAAGPSRAADATLTTARAAIFCDRVEPTSSGQDPAPASRVDGRAPCRCPTTRLVRLRRLPRLPPPPGPFALLEPRPPWLRCGRAFTAFRSSTPRALSTSSCRARGGLSPPVDPQI